MFAAPVRSARAPTAAATARAWQPLAASRRCAKLLAGVTTGFFLQRMEGVAPVCRARKEEGGSGMTRPHDGRGREGALRRDIAFDHGFEEQAALLGDAAPGLVVQNLFSFRVQ